MIWVGRVKGADLGEKLRMLACSPQFSLLFGLLFPATVLSIGCFTTLSLSHFIFLFFACHSALWWERCVTSKRQLDGDYFSTDPEPNSTHFNSNPRHSIKTLGSLSNYDDDGNKNPTNLHIWHWKTIFARAFFIFWHFEDVLVLSTTWNDLFCSCVDGVSIYDDKCSISVFLCQSTGSNLIPE